MPASKVVGLLKVEITVRGSYLGMSLEISCKPKEQAAKRPVTWDLSCELEVPNPDEFMNMLHCWLLSIETRVKHCSFEFDTLTGRYQLSWTRTLGQHGDFSLSSITRSPFVLMEISARDLVFALRSALSNQKIRSALAKI